MISEIHNMDCMKLMRQYPDKHFDLAVVDPPYGIGMDGNNNWSGSKHEVKNWDKCAPSIEYFQHLFRISKNQVIWGANHFTTKINKDSSCWLIWDKKNDGFSFADAEMAWTSFETAVRFFRYQRGQQTDSRIHPTQKPVALYDWIFKNYAKPGQLILDTHLGSGSSRIAADKAGLNFVGCELDTDYFAAHQKRWNEYKLQMKLL